MKKVLFATTALIATASVAAADVNMNGYGRFGATYSDARPKNDEIRYESRFRLNVNVSTEADNGLSFGGRVRFQSDDGNRIDGNGANFYVKAGGLKVAVGNVSGAIDAMPGMYSQSLGLTGLGYHNVTANSISKGYWGFDGYESNNEGRDAVALSYKQGDFDIYASYSSGKRTAVSAGVERSSIYAAYTFSGWTVALGYQDSSVNTEDKLSLTVGGKVGIAKINFSATDNDGVAKYGLGADFSVGAATTISAFVNSEEEVGRAGGTAYGIGVKHDLGGGASIRGGVVQSAKNAAGNDATIADLGLFFSF